MAIRSTRRSQAACPGEQAVRHAGLQRSKQARQWQGYGGASHQPHRIFENPALDFSQNRADGDDLLGDAYEYHTTSPLIPIGRNLNTTKVEWAIEKCRLHPTDLCDYVGRAARWCGSPLAAMTTGIIVVAFFAAKTAGVPRVTITSTCARTSSSASCGKRCPIVPAETQNPAATYLVWRGGR